MSIVVEFAPEEEARLRAEAAQRGQDTSAYAAALLRQSIGTGAPVPHPHEGQSLADTLGKRAGRLRSPQPSNMAINSEEEFGKIMDEKQRQGHV